MAFIWILEGILFLGIFLRFLCLLHLGLFILREPLLHVFLVASFQIPPLFIVHADELQRSNSFGVNQLFLHVHSLHVRFITELFILLIKLELGLLKWVVLLESDVHQSRLRTFLQTHTPFAGVVWVFRLSFFNVFNHVSRFNIFDFVTEYLFRSSIGSQAVGTVAMLVNIVLREVVGAVNLLIRRACRSSPRRKGSPGRRFRLRKAHISQLCGASSTRLAWCCLLRKRILWLLFLHWNAIFVFLD